jgi:trehalose-phosphatase
MKRDLARERERADSAEAQVGQEPKSAKENVADWEKLHTPEFEAKVKAVAWDKGVAARWMLTRVFGERWPSQVGVIYIGDDRTDEDAFMALREDAVTIKVGAGSYPTAARYIAEHVDEVGRFLQILAREAARQVTRDQ